MDLSAVKLTLDVDSRLLVLEAPALAAGPAHLSMDIFPSQVGAYWLCVKQNHNPQATMLSLLQLCSCKVVYFHRCLRLWLHGST